MSEDRAGKNEERLVSLYSAMLASALRQRELASLMGAQADATELMDGFMKEAERRDLGAAEIERVLPSVMKSGVRAGATLERCRSIARQILEVDAESVRLIEQAKARVSGELEQVARFRQYLGAYRGMLGGAATDAGFIDRMR